MRTSIRVSGWVLLALPMLGACQLDWVKVEEEVLVAASVTVVLTVDPMDSTIQKPISPRSTN